jgi:RNA polymerase primary sigma factor
VRYSRPASSLRTYLDDIRAYPVLSREQESRVGARLRSPESEEAAHDLIRSNLGFVVRVALSYQGRTLPLEDLLNEGNLGLVQAARRFDPSRGTRFLTFAVHWIRKAILAALERQCSVVHLPGHKRRRAGALRRAERALESELGRRPEREELSRKTGVSSAEIDLLQRLFLHDVSLEEPIGDGDDLTRLDVLAHRHASDPEAELLREEDRGHVASLLEVLREKERRVIALRYGFGDGECRTLREIAAEMGVSREAVRLVEARALRRMHQRLMTLRSGGSRRGDRARRNGGAGQPQGRTPSMKETAYHRAASGRSPQVRRAPIAAACAPASIKPAPMIASPAPSRMRARFSTSAGRRSPPAQAPKSTQVERIGCAPASCSSAAIFLPTNGSRPFSS